MANSAIQDLSKQLLDAKARWVAIESPLSLMAPEDRKKLLGANVSDSLKVPKTATVAAPTAGLPASVDWRNRNGNHVSPVKDQGGCGSCVSFCTVAVTESMVSIEKNQLPDLS